MRRRSSLVRSAWVLAAIAALAFHLHAVYFTGATDSYVVLGWAMILLTFPLGFLAMLAYGFVAQLAKSATSDVALWILMAAAGYFQWFWAVPRVIEWKKLRNIPGQHP
jgi:hypothetical protein